MKPFKCGINTAAYFYHFSQQYHSQQQQQLIPTTTNSLVNLTTNQTTNQTLINMRSFVFTILMSAVVMASPAVYVRKASGADISGIRDFGGMQQQQISPNLQQQQLVNPTWGESSFAGVPKTVDFRATPESVNLAGVMSDSMQEQLSPFGGQQQLTKDLDYRSGWKMSPERELLITRPGVEKIWYDQLTPGRIVKYYQA